MIVTKMFKWTVVDLQSRDLAMHHRVQEEMMSQKRWVVKRKLD